MFVHDLAAAYAKWAKHNNLKAEIVDSQRGQCSLKIVGDNAERVFQQESGAHCIQRIPPTETKGRRQTSYIKVSVLPIPSKSELKMIPKSELEIFCEVGSGPGGQHRNRTASCVRMRHKPTGTEVYIDGRCQQQNRKLAHKVLSAKVSHAEEIKSKERYDRDRKSQQGTGARGNKIRTYNFIKSRVADHRTGAKTNKVKEVIEKGRFDLIGR